MPDMLGFGIWVIVPITVSVIVVVCIIVASQIYKARLVAKNSHSFGEVVSGLRGENAKILSELTLIKENLDSINQMMKEIE